MVVLLPAIYVEVGFVVIVTAAVVLLNNETTSPLANVLFGTVIKPPVPMPMNLPTSVVASV